MSNSSASTGNTCTERDIDECISVGANSLVGWGRFAVLLASKSDIHASVQQSKAVYFTTECVSHLKPLSEILPQSVWTVNAPSGSIFCNRRSKDLFWKFKFSAVGLRVTSLVAECGTLLENTGQIVCVQENMDTLHFDDSTGQGKMDATPECSLKWIQLKRHFVTCRDSIQPNLSFPLCDCGMLGSNQAQIVFFHWSLI